jgi:hypothetical protein
MIVAKLTVADLKTQLKARGLEQTVSLLLRRRPNVGSLASFCRCARAALSSDPAAAYQAQPRLMVARRYLSAYRAFNPRLQGLKAELIARLQAALDAEAAAGAAGRADAVNDDGGRDNNLREHSKAEGEHAEPESNVEAMEHEQQQQQQQQGDGGQHAEQPAAGEEGASGAPAQAGDAEVGEQQAQGQQDGGDGVPAEPATAAAAKATGTAGDGGAEAAAQRAREAAAREREVQRLAWKERDRSPRPRAPPARAELPSPPPAPGRLARAAEWQRMEVPPAWVPQPLLKVRRRSRRNG